MKILLVHDYAAPAGGAEISTITLRDRLRARGHDARLFTSSAGSPTGQADYECLGTTSRFRTLLQTLNPSAYWQLKQVLRDFNPAVVQVGMFLTQLSPLILPLLNAIPASNRVHWYRLICPTGTKFLPGGQACRFPVGGACYSQGCLPPHDWLPLMLQMTLFRHWRKAFRLYVVNSVTMQQALANEGLTPTEVIWPTVSLRPPNPPLAGPPLIVFASRLVPLKGATVLIEAFSQVLERTPQARLLIAGDGPQRRSLEILVQQRAMTQAVEFAGHLSESDLEARCQSAWVQVVPSIWAEPFGRVAVEAMMRGTAVVASRCGGLAEIVVPNETGLLVEPGDATALASALTQIVSDRALAERLGRAGRQRALTEFNETIIIDRYEKTYFQLAGNL